MSKEEYRALKHTYLPTFVAGVPVWLRETLPCCVLWFVVVPCSPVPCHVVLCFRVQLCCGTLLSVLLCWWCLFALFSFKYLGKTRKKCFPFLKINSNYTQIQHTCEQPDQENMSTYMLPAVGDGLQLLLPAVLARVPCKGLTVGTWRTKAKQRGAR